MSKKKKIQPGLGKGLGALLPSVDFANEQQEASEESGEKKPHAIAINIDVDRIRTNPYQPRSDFDREALLDLKNSILEHGLIQPITVRRSIHGYELVSGARRLRASREAGLSHVPAYVMDIESDSKLLELALIENVQREDLNPIEIAHGYKRLMEECSYTQEEVSKKVAKERSTVTNFLRLLRLPEMLQESLRKKEISMGHARTLLALEDQTSMIMAGKEILNKKLSVRQTEKLVKDLAKSKTKDNKSKKNKERISKEVLAILEDNADHLRKSFGTNVKITPKSKESGVISFEFYSRDDLERLLEIFDTIETDA